MSLLSPELQAFVAIVKKSTVHGAARQIGLTQTAVTQRIRGLERKIGTTLFTRSRKGMSPTEEGKALYVYCQKVLDIEGETLSLIKGDTHQKNIHIEIVGSSSIMRSRVIPGSTKLLDRYKDITFTYHITDDESPVRYLKSGECQFAVLSPLEVPNELDSKMLEPEIYVMVAAPRFKTKDVKDILKTERLVDFNYGDKFTLLFLKKYGLTTLAKKEGHYVNNTDALVSLLINGHGYSVLSKRFVEPYIKNKQLVEIMPGKYSKIEFALAWYPRHEMPKYFKELIKLID
ncbi:MAG: LysR family transcriptional regulator [Pseudomonadota bacterium]